MKIGRGLVKSGVPLSYARFRGRLRLEPDRAASQRVPVLTAFAGRDRCEWSLSDANGASSGHSLTTSVVNKVTVLAQVQLSEVFLDTCNAGPHPRTLDVQNWGTVGCGTEI